MFEKVVVFVLVFVLILLMASPAGSSDPLPLKKPWIAIDPGHGGQDLGSTACKEILEQEGWSAEKADVFLEKNVNLDIALRLRKLLTDGGWKNVYMTRTEDVDLSSHDRAAGINASGADVLVNLHLNGWSDPQMDGLYVFYGKARKDKAFVQVMHDTMLGNEGLTATQDVFIDFGIRQFAAGVLLWAEMPSALLESAFISNTWECYQLSNLNTDDDSKRQDQIAQAIYEGLVAWFSDPQSFPHGNNNSDW